MKHQINSRQCIFFVVEKGYLLSNYSNGDLSVRLEHHMFFFSRTEDTRRIIFSPGSSSGILLGII